MSRSTEPAGEVEAALIAAATAIRGLAYAPYSSHPVGAAIADETGAIHVGCNVENAAYPQGVCAEASAISAMIAAGGRRILAVAISGPGAALCTPCGGCRQKIREFAAPETPVLICDAEGRVLARFTLDQLLPVSFGPDNLAG